MARYLSAGLVAVLLLAVGPPTHAAGAGDDMADLHAKTIAAFDRYIRLTEARMARETGGQAPFVMVDGLPDARKTLALADLRRSQLVIERLETKDNGKGIDVPDGLIHHWVGMVFVPNVPVEKAVALMQDYDHHAELFKPAVVRSKILSRSGDDFRIYLRFTMKRVLTAVLNTEHDVHFARPAPDRVYSVIRSTRIAEVDNADTPAEREKPIGNDSGFMWRFNTYWRFLQRDGGTYVQCESISLSRGIPFGFGWLIGPFVTSIPKDSLTFTLERARDRLAQ